MRHSSPRHHAKHAVRMRDAGLKRVSVATRVLVAGAVGATGLFSALAAWAQPGRAKVGATSTTAPQATPGGSLSLGRCDAPAATTPATAPAADDGYGTTTAVAAAQRTSRRRSRCRHRRRCRPRTTSTRVRRWFRTRRSVMQDRVTFPALGTTAELLVDDAGTFDDALARFELEIEAIDAACSRFRADSELSRVNANAGGDRRSCPRCSSKRSTLHCRAAELTDGRVDPTVGPRCGCSGTTATSTRSTGPVRRCASRSDAFRVGRRSKSTTSDRRCGYRPVSSWISARPPRRSAPTVPARAIGARDRHGVLVGLGGDIAVGGRPRAGLAGVGHRRLVAAFAVDARRRSASSSGRGGVATSGTTVRRWRRGEVTLHHVIDPTYRAPGGGALALGDRCRRVVRRRQHREHRRHRPRRPRAGLARAARPTRLGWLRATGRRARRRLAGRSGAAC